ncbi:MAG TPA: DinB family protein [Gammaproteobacteria bacterium]|nr:DinB family protein [Gammaproteobacteria bacterium]
MLARQAQTMAAYNRWMNDKLYAACAELSDEDRKLDRKAFFGSIHGTLNHLLLADRIWFGRFTGRPLQVQSLRQELFADFNELRAERTLTDQDIEGWTQGLTDAQLAAKVKFTTIVDPAARVYELWVCVTHFFNHQTHHRGQLTTLLSQCGKDYGVTDLIWLPELAPRA